MSGTVYKRCTKCGNAVKNRACVRCGGSASVKWAYRAYVGRDNTGKWVRQLRSGFPTKKVLLQLVPLRCGEDRLTDADRPRLEVELGPPKSEELGPTDTGAGREEPHGVKLMVARAAKEGTQLVVGPGVHAPSARGLHRLERGWIGQHDDVALHTAPPHRVVERLAQHGVDSPNRGG